MLQHGDIEKRNCLHREMQLVPLSGDHADTFLKRHFFQYLHVIKKKKKTDASSPENYEEQKLAIKSNITPILFIRVQHFLVAQCFPFSSTQFV